MKTLGIIIPHYNSEEKLIRLLETIKWTNYIEVIVIDDNSSNFDKKKLKEKFKDLKTYTNEFKKGAGGARNTGIKKANSKYLIFADSDDLFLPGYHDVLSLFFEKNFDVVFFKTRSIIEGTNKSSKRHIFYNSLIDKYLSSSKKEELFPFFSPCNKLIRSDLIISNQIRFEEIPAGNDVMFSANIFKESKNINVCEIPIYLITESENSITKNKSTTNLYSRLHGILRLNQFIIDNEIKVNQFSTRYHISNAYRELGLGHMLKFIGIVAINRIKSTINFIRA